MPKERVRLASSKPQPLYQRPPHHISQHQQHGSRDSMDDDVISPETLSPADSDSLETSSQEAALAAESRTNLIVNYLPQSMCQDDLRTLFSSVGSLDSCKLIRDKTTGNSLGYGFVRYKTTEVAEKAIKTLNGLRVQNKILKVSLARPSCDNIKGANLYVGGLPRHVTSHDLINMFSTCGQIITARVLSDPTTGLTKGVGFIRFNLKSEAEMAIKTLSGTVPPGATEPITVKFANQPTFNKATTSSVGPTHFVGTVPTAASALVPTPTLTATNYRFADYDTLLPSGAMLPGMAGYPAGTQLLSAAAAAGPFTLCVSNLPVDTDDAVLWQIFQPLGAVQSIQCVRDPVSNKSKGVALVTMLHYTEALTAALRLNGQHIAGHVLQVTLLNGPPTTAAAPGYLPSSYLPSAMLSGAGAGLVFQAVPGGYYATSQHTAAAGHQLPYGLVQLPIM